MLPDWMKQNEAYAPPKDGGAFAIKTIKKLGEILARIRVQRGQERKGAIPAIWKLLAAIGGILLLSVSRSGIVLLGMGAAVLILLCFLPAVELWETLKTAFGAAFLTALIFLPATVMNPGGIRNHAAVVIKVFLSVVLLGCFHRVTQWNHITGALKKLHIPGIFIFTLDITLKYIVILGTMIQDLLTTYGLKSVGRNRKKYSSVGGVMGVTYVKSAEYCQETYEAMRCRGFTDDYKGLT